MRKRGLRLTFTVLWIQLLALPDKLNPILLTVPGAPVRSNLAILAAFYCLGTLLLVGTASVGTLLVAVLMGAECIAELMGGLFCCIFGVTLASLLLKKWRGRIRPLWVPAPIGAITGGLAVAASYPFSEPDLYCWLGGIYSIIFAILSFTGGAGLAALMRSRRQLIEQYSHERPVAP